MDVTYMAICQLNQKDSPDVVQSPIGRDREDVKWGNSVCGLGLRGRLAWTAGNLRAAHTRPRCSGPEGLYKE